MIACPSFVHAFVTTNTLWYVAAVVWPRTLLLCEDVPVSDWPSPLCLCVSLQTSLIGVIVLAGILVGIQTYHIPEGTPTDVLK